MSHLFVCFVTLLFKVVLYIDGQMLAIAPLQSMYGREQKEKSLSTIFHSSWYRGRVNLIFRQIQVGMAAKLWDMSHLFICFVTLVIPGGAMAKFWPFHHHNQCIGEYGEKTLSNILNS